MPAAPAWCLDGDVIVLGALRVTVERIAASHWRPDARLRSWGPAPMRRENDAVLLPCAADECLWLGAWLEDDAMADTSGGPPEGAMAAPVADAMASASPARITVHDPANGARAAATLPEAYQIGTLRSAHAPPAPLQLAPPDACRRLRLELECGAARAAFELILLPPAAWAAHAHRAPPAPLDAPPPLPPRLA